MRPWWRRCSAIPPSTAPTDRERAAIWAGRRDEVVRGQKEDLVALVRKLEWDIVPVWLTYSDQVDYRPARYLSDDRLKWLDADGNTWQAPSEAGDALCTGSRPLTPELLEEMLADAAPGGRVPTGAGPSRGEGVGQDPFHHRARLAWSLHLAGRDLSDAGRGAGPAGPRVPAALLRQSGPGAPHPEGLHQAGYRLWQDPDRRGRGRGPDECGLLHQHGTVAGAGALRQVHPAVHADDGGCLQARRACTC